MKYTVITTFNTDGYNRYGRRMIETFLQTWPSTVELRVYAEDCQVTQTAPNLKVFDLHAASPELVAFKTRWQGVSKANGNVLDDPVRSKRKDAGKGFKWDAVRFSHKVYAIFHAAKNADADWLIWMDADMVCHSPIKLEFIESMCPTHIDLCYLGRTGKFSECGLYAVNLRTQLAQNFLQEFQRYYDDAENGIFTLGEWHDSYVFDAVRAQIGMAQLDWSAGLIKGEGHPLINSAWGAYLDHLKGERKTAGQSLKKDIRVQRNEAYWQSIR